jgi:hypothetical protein
MKYILSYDLGLLTEPPELPQMVKDLNSMGLLRLMEFRKYWNNKIILQFYASYHHEKDKTGATDIIHWTTDGKHYKVDFITFSRLLGFNGYDHRATELVEYEELRWRSTSTCILTDILQMARLCT